MTAGERICECCGHIPPDHRDDCRVTFACERAVQAVRDRMMMLDAPPEATQMPSAARRPILEGERVRVVGAEPSKWNGAIAKVTRVYPADGRPNLECVATVESPDLGITTWTMRHLEHADEAAPSSSPAVDYTTVAKGLVIATLAHIDFFQTCPFCKAGQDDGDGCDRPHEEECALVGFDQTRDCEALRAWAKSTPFTSPAPKEKP